MRCSTRSTTLLSWIAALAGAASAAGCLVPFGLPPTRTELGAATATSDEGPSLGLRGTVGVSWASGATSRTHARDAVAGYAYERLGAASDDADGGARSLHGGFVEYGQVVSLGHTRRTWVSGRGELLHVSGDDGGLAWGASARATWELFGAGSGSQPVSARCAVGTSWHWGSTALGVYVEGGYRRMPDVGPAFVATAGVSVRLPTFGMLALVIPIPGC